MRSLPDVPPVSLSAFARAGLLLLAVAAGPALAGTTSYVWPGTLPCNATLQACIDGAAPDAEIVIVTSEPIDETLNIPNRSLTLRAAPGVDAQFAPGNNVFIGVAPISGDVVVVLEGLTFTDGYVSVSFNNAGNGAFTLRDLTFRQALPTTFGGYIGVRALGGTVDARIERNRLRGRPTGINAAMISLEADGAELNARVFENRITRAGATPGDGAGIQLSAVNGGSGTTRVHGNTVRGGFFRGGVHFSEGLAALSPSDYSVRAFNNVVVGPSGGDAGDGNGNGIAMTVDAGRLHAVVVNNTVTNASNGILALRWVGGEPTAQVEGTVLNNVIAAFRGLTLSSELAALPTNDHNLINAASNVATLGPATITAPARLQSSAVPRLTAASPAIDAADTAALGLGIILNALPATDADGLRRIKGPEPVSADIGAYEFGDTAFLHAAEPATTFANETQILHPSTTSMPAANVFATPYRASASVYDRPLGVYQSGSRWAVFSQDGSTMPLDAHFEVFVPAAGSGTFRHTATAANSFGNYTSLDNSALNDLGDRIVLVTQNWSIAPIYNPHPVGLFWNGTRWFIDNMDDAPMPENAGFNVYAQAPSPNAFRVVPDTGASLIPLPHPLLDGNPCAAPQVTRQYVGDDVANHFAVRYDGGGWRVDTFGTPVSAGTQFHVLVLPAQAETCGAVLFGDGLESAP
ncbi:DUF7452 domain-containing protein [Chiayiivirga flava]|uniref:DUF7452 domain-containing protein n=1 Tax=Chiayiivirga flava TaxID=659595 RepID=A0A7W8D6L4_9GAMM|nr:choice-of-anchor Q domain-containing protein [Chiayiivirga flava]MBB5207661.1 hypothetical protein [Chiayiivirga flava]